MAGRTITPEFLKRLAIPKTHWLAMISRIPNTCKHKKTVRDWCENVVENIKKPKGLLLLGEYSQGKSAIGAICLKAAACQGIIGFWVSARSLTEYKIEKTRFDDFQTMWDRACSVPLLVLDEVQIRETNKFGEQALEDLIRYRIENQLCTVLTTNHGRHELDSRCPSIMAVLREAVVPVTISGHDFRTDRAKELA